MSRRLRVTVRGLPVDVVYTERGQDVVWYLASVNWRLLACDRPLGLTESEIRAIDTRCVSDRNKRRRAWNRQLANRDKSRQSTEKSQHAC